MLFRLFLLFTVVPIIEIWLLIKVGRVIGALPTVGLLLAISLVGAWLAKSQGLRTIAAIRDELAAGRLPAARLLDGAMILAGGVLLLTPGFFTDFLGLFFLFPLSRTFLKKWLGNYLERNLAKGTITIYRR
ncbi:MAG: FxsA family protein [Geobacteraceae bacterium]